MSTTNHDTIQAAGHVVADPERFFDADYIPILHHMISRIVEREGPIRLERLAYEIAQKHRWKKAGRKIRKRVRHALGPMECHHEFGEIFIWAPRSYADRVTFQGLNGRPIEHISRTKITSVIDAHTPQLAEEKDQILALSRLLGIKRLSKKAREYLSKCTIWHEDSTKEPIRALAEETYYLSAKVRALSAMVTHAIAQDAKTDTKKTPSTK